MHAATYLVTKLADALCDTTAGVEQVHDGTFTWRRASNIPYSLYLDSVVAKLRLPSDKRLKARYDTRMETCDMYSMRVQAAMPA